MKKLGIFLCSLIAIGIASYIPFKIWHLEIPQKTLWNFYDQKGLALYEEFSTTKETNEVLENLLLLQEDRDFYNHCGINLLSLFRAIIQNKKAGEIISGGSTITMQVARILFLKNEPRTIRYKIKQIFLALKLEEMLSKKEILDLYKTNIPLGNNTQGFEEAAKKYFDKSVTNLSLVESAVLVGIIPRPEDWNPIKNAKKADERKNKIISIAEKKGFLNKKEANFWEAQKIKISDQEKKEIIAPHFIFWAKEKLRKQIGENAGKIKIYTTLNKDKYEKTKEILQKNKERFKEKNISDAGVIVLSLPENKIEIFVGGIDFFEKKTGAINIADSQRETGSVLKPFLYALALEKGFSPLTLLRDERQSFPSGKGTYSPRNFETKKEHGLVTFREALSNSYNISAVELLNKIGVQFFLSFLKKLDISKEIDPEKEGLSLILGTGSSTLLKLTQGYSIFPQKGILRQAQFFTKIENEKGEKILTWEQYSPTFPKKILSLESAEWITHTLSDKSARWQNFSRGNPLELDFETASKTGTSQDFRDNYVIGYSSQNIVGIWVGNKDGTPMDTVSGIEGAGPIYHEIMKLIHDAAPPKFEYQSKRKEIEINEKKEFLLPEEIQNEQKNYSKERSLKITFPGQGDIFHKNSPILVETNKKGNIQIFIDGKRTEKIIPNPSPGKHKIRAENETESDEIEIFIEK